MLRRYSLLGAFALVVLISCSKKGSEQEPPEPDPPATQVDIVALDNAVTAFMTTYNIAGASFAVSKNGKLVYVKGYGFADKETNEKVTISHRFRLASVSKTYTGAAIMKLAQEGKLSLSSKVFGADGILGTQYGTAPYNANVSAMTVKDLVQNTTGSWGANTGGDVIDQNPAYSTQQLMNWILNTRPNPKAPNTYSDYSNVGFWIAGRVIEKVSNKTYINYIKEDLLAGTGAGTGTDIAGKTLAERKTNEVKYYGQGAEAAYPYQIAFPRRDADGGLIASASDVLRFITATDGHPSREDVLNVTAVEAMVTPTAAAGNYACGIARWPEQEVFYNYGSLPGTRTGFMRHATNGMAAVILFNGKVVAANDNAFAQGMQNILLNTLKNYASSWQANLDQF